MKSREENALKLTEGKPHMHAKTFVLTSFRRGLITSMYAHHQIT